MIFITALVLIFILRLRFPKGKSVAAINNFCNKFLVPLTFIISVYSFNIKQPIAVQRLVA